MAKQPAAVVEVRDFQFVPEKLVVKPDQSVRYVIRESSPAAGRSLYHNKERFYILFVAETQDESTPLYAGDSFEYVFPQTGVFRVGCFNYVRMQQTVCVYDGDDDSATAETERSTKKPADSSLLSDEVREDCRTQFPLFDDISACLRGMAREGDSTLKAFESLFERDFYRQEVQLPVPGREQSVSGRKLCGEDLFSFRQFNAGGGSPGSQRVFKSVKEALSSPHLPGAAMVEAKPARIAFVQRVSLKLSAHFSSLSPKP